MRGDQAKSRKTYATITQKLAKSYPIMNITLDPRDKKLKEQKAEPKKLTEDIPISLSDLSRVIKINTNLSLKLISRLITF